MLIRLVSQTSGLKWPCFSLPGAKAPGTCDHSWLSPIVIQHGYVAILISLYSLVIEKVLRLPVIYGNLFSMFLTRPYDGISFGSIDLCHSSVSKGETDSPPLVSHLLQVKGNRKTTEISSGKQNCPLNLQATGPSTSLSHKWQAAKSSQKRWVLKWICM